MNAYESERKPTIQKRGRSLAFPVTLAAIMLAAAALALLWRASPPASAAGVTITVDTPTDGDVRDSVLTLHEAIKLATGALSVGDLTTNECDQVSGIIGVSPCTTADTIGAGSPDTVVFSVASIALTGTLPALSTGGDTINGASAVTVDGVTKAFDCFLISGEGSDSNVIKGLVIKRCADGITVEAGADANVIGGTTAGDRNVIQDNGGSGVVITGAGTTGNIVRGNYIGTDAGTAAAGNVAGVVISGGASANTIGGGTAGERNVISGNTGNGMSIIGPSTSGNFVRGNYIGTNAAGTAAIANGGEGIRIDSGAQSNTIGGSVAGQGNVISGNTMNGMFITDPSTSGNTVSGNYIGTNAAGTGPVANVGAGVALFAPSNTIGGLAATTGTPPGNVISGNSAGILIKSNDADSNFVQGNLIGTNATGTGPVANTDTGVYFSLGPDNNTIGGSAAGARNVISGNTLKGINLFDPATTGNVVQGNYIGTDITGTSAIGSVIGVHIGVSNTGSTVGGSSAGEGNVIAFNSQSGVCVEGGSSGASIRGNSMHSNTLLGIDLIDPLGGEACSVGNVTPNDAYPDGDTGPNNLQNFPTITGATYDGIVTIISVEGPTFAGGDYLIDIYASQAADGSGNGEGQAYVGSKSFTGPGAWNYVMVGLPPFAVLTATATDAFGNTSEFSPVFHTDLDGDGFTSAADDCPFAYNPYQMDHDADGVGDVCDSIVRNRYAVSSSSLIDEYSTAPGEEIPSETQTFQPWDYNPGSAVDIGSIVGELDFSFVVSVGNTPCYFGVKYENRVLYNASIDNSPGNLVSTANILTSSGGDPNLVDGIEKYPSFLNTWLDQERLTGIDSDGDGLVDEDGATNSDGDGLVDEDPAGSPPTLHARYFGAYGGSSFFQILVFEIVPDTLYRRVVVFNDPTTAMFPNIESCAPLEFRSTINTNNADNPATTTVEAVPVDAVLGAATAGTHVTRLEVVQPPDKDGDGDVNYRDNCPSIANADQGDSDADGIGDVCEPTSGSFCVSDAVLDCDGDTFYNLIDNCPTIANGPLQAVFPWIGNQTDSEKRTPLPFGAYYVGDAIGDACDPNPTLVDTSDELTVTRYSDAACITGTGVTDGDGDGWCIATVSGSIAVGTAPHDISVNPNTARAYVANNSTNNVSVIDLTANTVLTTVAVGASPEGVAVNTATNRIYVANSGGAGTVSVIDGNINSVIGTITLGGTPWNVAVDEGLNRIYVTNRSANSVAVINGADNSVVTTVSVGTNPEGVDVNEVTNRIYVANVNSFNLSVIDGATFAVTTVALGSDNTFDVAVNETTNKVYIGYGLPSPSTKVLKVLDGLTNTVTATIPGGLSGVPWGVAVNETNNLVYAAVEGANVHVFDGSTNTVTLAWPFISSPYDVAVDTVTGTAYLTRAGLNDVAILPQGLDPNDSNAAITPERVGAFGSCTNGVDDDGTGGTDAADVHCTDSDGDAVPDAADVCPRAADPLQLDADGDSQGDACESAVIADLDVFPTTNSANSELRGRLVEPAPFMLHRNNGGIALLTDPGWTITSGASVTNGAIREVLSATVTAAVSPSHTCNTTLPLNFTLMDASTNPADTIAPGTNFSGLLADASPANGLPDGVDKMPSFLTRLPQLSVGVDNDSDFNIDEDPYDSVDNDADGFVDEDQYDVTPLVRMFASTTLGGANLVANVLVYSPGVLVPFTDPVGQGYPAILIIGDPTSPAPASTISALCTSQDIRHIRYGVSLTNPGTGAGAGGGEKLLTSSPSGTRLFFTRIITQPDGDSDRIENSLDTCVSDRDNDNDTINDDVDASPWNPRLVSPPGDDDGDGIPVACDSSPGGGGGGFAFAPSVHTTTTCSSTLPNDCDGDGVNNTADNCPFNANTNQADSDGDGIGSPCDPAPAAPTGAIQQVVAGTPLCVGNIGGDGDKDGYCFAEDPDDTDDKVTKEDSTYDPLKCGNTIDDDEDALIDMADNSPPPACQDVDNDGILNQSDNCPNTTNTDQADHDVDGSVGQQPFSRSDLGDITIMGQPFSRSAKYGGDACDPDDDNDGLADSSDPCPTDLDKDCDNDLLQDVVEWTFSTLNNVTDPLPPVRCLHPNDSDYWPSPPSGNGQPDWNENPDGDAMFTYGEALIGTDPCTSDNPLGVDNDLDGFKTGLELYTTTSPTVKCATTTTLNDETVDAQVTDNNDDRKSGLSDILAYIPVFNTQLPSSAFNRRYDLNIDGKVGLADILGFIPFFNLTCTP